MQCTASGRNACDTQRVMQPAVLTRGCTSACQLSDKSALQHRRSQLPALSPGLCPFSAAGASPAERQPAGARCWTLAGWCGASAVRWLWWERGLPPAAQHHQFLEESAAGHCTEPSAGLLHRLAAGSCSEVSVVPVWLLHMCTGCKQLQHGILCACWLNVMLQG